MPIDMKLMGHPPTSDDGLPVTADSRYGRSGRSGDAVIYVSPLGSDSNTGLSPGLAKLTLSGAISALSSLGGTIELLNGTTSITAKVVSTLSNLRIHGGRGAILKAKNALNDVMLELSGDNVHLEGFVVDGNKANQTVGNTSCGIHLSSITNSTVSNLLIHDVIAHGLLLDNSLGAWTDIELTDNVVRNNGDTTNLGNGITVVAGNRAIVTGNRCLTNVGDGIYTQSLIGCTVNSNVCKGNRGYGIEMSTLIASCTITANTCIGNTESGIGCDGVVTFTANTVAANTCEVNGGAGIQLDAGAGNPVYNSVLGNTCRNNSIPGLIRVDVGVAGLPTVTQTRDGIECSGSQKFTFVGNTCFDDQTPKTQRYPFSDGGGTTSHVIVGNEFPDNALGGMSLSGSGNIVGLNGHTITSPGGVLITQSTSPGNPSIWSDDGQRIFIEVTGNVKALLTSAAGGLRQYFMGPSGEVDTYLERTAAGILSASGGKLTAAAGFGAGNTAVASTPGTVVRRMEIFNSSGASLGFIPIYDAIT